MIWTSSDVAGGDEVLASQYNELRADTANGFNICCSYWNGFVMGRYRCKPQLQVG